MELSTEYMSCYRKDPDRMRKTIIEIRADICRIVDAYTAHVSSPSPSLLKDIKHMISNFLHKKGFYTEFHVTLKRTRRNWVKEEVVPEVTWIYDENRKPCQEAGVY